MTVVWPILALLCCSWPFLATFGQFWLLIVAFGRFLLLSAAFGHVWSIYVTLIQLWALFVNFWSLLAAPSLLLPAAGHCFLQLRPIFGHFWRSSTCIPAFHSNTCICSGTHMRPSRSIHCCILPSPASSMRLQCCTPAPQICCVHLHIHSNSGTCIPHPLQ